MSIADLKEKLQTNCLVALADTHTQANAREDARELINSGLVKIFFIEYQFSADSNNGAIANEYGAKLNAAISEMLDLKVSYEKALEILNTGGYFRLLNSTDSEPSLKELTARAIGMGVQVLACDKDYQDTQEELNKKNCGALSLASPTAIEIRDEFASDTISNYLKVGTNVETGRLMLWGAGHFTENAPTEKFPDARLQTLLANKGVDPIHIEE
ncbi:hypothetical protein ACJJIF_04915 [Microbulbifer sp. SSSA002]|uniref:hypothetical protein n=1 Tax=unclassified Microbulbifer TaxID=2619833 RepID=UPI00403A0F60